MRFILYPCAPCATSMYSEVLECLLFSCWGGFLSQCHLKINVCRNDIDNVTRIIYVYISVNVHCLSKLRFPFLFTFSCCDNIFSFTIDICLQGFDGFLIIVVCWYLITFVLCVILFLLVDSTILLLSKINNVKLHTINSF